MKRMAISTLFGVLFSVVIAVTQGPPPKPTPAPELKKLDYFVGTWKSTGELKPGPMGPGGKFTSIERNEWMPGHFFLVTHGDSNGVIGHVIETAYFGYNAEDKNYTYDAFNSMGEAEHFKGNVEGDTWTWISTEKMGGQTMKARFILTIASPTTYSFKFEIAPEGGGDYTTVVEGKATKVVAAKAAKGAEGGAVKK
ncbi:MAG TPA: DUF1579 family protein [Candidatus Angelobacter sp.]